MYLDFSKDVFRQYALNITAINYENQLTPHDAFLLLLLGIDFESINNLCEEVARNIGIDNAKYIGDIISRGPNSIKDAKIKQLILATAYDIIHKGGFLGNKVNEYGFNTSSWISHCLYEGELASNLASRMGLDPDTAKKLGILHDIGRKFNHSGGHITIGYEYLLSLGYKEEAICSITHSFLPVLKNNNLKGNRFANCGPVLEGFYIDDEGNGALREGSKLDDVTRFLENYQYNLYDVLINIADLMADSTGILAPYDRVKLILGRRKNIDSQGISFFKVCLINMLRWLMFSINGDEKNSKQVNITDFPSPDDIERKLQTTSEDFFQMFQKGNSQPQKRY